MAHKIINWENDPIEAPEDKVIEFAKRKFPNYELEILSSLRHRDIREVYDTLNDHRVVIMLPYLFDREQIKNVVSYISHPIHINFSSSTREMDIREFIFLSSNPWEDLKIVLQSCKGLKDSVGENALAKIVKHCDVHFFGFDNEHYQLQLARTFDSEIIAIRHN